MKKKTTYILFSHSRDKQHTNVSEQSLERLEQGLQTLVQSWCCTDRLVQNIPILHAGTGSLFPFQKQKEHLQRAWAQGTPQSPQAHE